MVNNTKAQPNKVPSDERVDMALDAKTRIAVNRVSEGLMTIVLEDGNSAAMPKIHLSGSKKGHLTVNTGCGDAIILDADTSADLRNWAELLLQAGNKQTTATTRGYVAQDLVNATRKAVSNACAAER